MGRNYYAKRFGNLHPDGHAQRTQEAQHRSHEHQRAIAAAYAAQDLPEVVIRGNHAECPYVSCARRQRSLAVGIHVCTNNRCERKFLVPDNEITRSIVRKLSDIAWRREEREQRASDILFSRYYGNNWK